MKKSLLWIVPAISPLLSAAVIAPITVDLTSMNLTGTSAVPLGRASGGGYQFVESQVVVAATAEGVATLTSEAEGPITQGSLLRLEISLTGTASLTFTDTDPAFDYFGLPSSFQRSGVSFSNNLKEGVTCIADLTKPNYGCLPPVGMSFAGLTGFRVDLPVDIDGNGLADKMLLDPFLHQVGEILSTTRTDSTVTTTYTLNSTLTGAVLDQASDPPFTVHFTGPVTGTQSIVVDAIPEPGTYLLSGAALAGLLAAGWRRRSRVNRRSQVR